MNRWQHIVNSNVASHDHRIKNARRRLTPAHIAFAAPTISTSSERLQKVRVLSAPILGHHVVADQTLEQGSTVLSEEPFVHEIDESWIGKRCSFCLSPNVTFRCRQCPIHRYCSATCETNNWTKGLHSIFCNLYGILDSDIILALKAYLKSSFNQRITPFCFSQRGVEISNLVSNIDRIHENDIKAYTTGAKFCVDLFYWPKEMVQSLVKTIAQIRCNRFAIKANISTSGPGRIIEHKETTIGSAVYIQASMFNHSCSPNAFVTFDGPLITVRCSEKVLKSEEVNISYGPIATRHSTTERQKDLAEKYLFQCNCRACTQSEQGNGVAYQCPSGNNNCKVYWQDQVCRTCNRPIDWVTIDQTERQAKKLKESASMVDDLFKALDIERRLYPKDSLLIGATYDQLAAFYANHQNFNTAAKYCSLSLSIVIQNYGKVSMESAEEHFKLATLLFNGHNGEEAYKAIKTCVSLFRKLGLDQGRTEDMQELKEMMKALGVR